MEKTIFRGNEKLAASVVAWMLETSPLPISSLTLGHLALETKLESMIPQIENFAASTFDLMGKGQHDEAWKGMEAFTRKLADEINLSPGDSKYICAVLLILIFMIDGMSSIKGLIPLELDPRYWQRKIWEGEH